MSIIRHRAPLAYEDSGGAIRVTPTGQPSVIDMIKVLGGQKSPTKFWERLRKAHPEVATICRDFKFPGPGQRLTPVARDKAAAYQILGHLPGACGDKYRQDAADLFVQALDNPAALINSLLPSLTDEEEKWVEARISGKRDRNKFTATLQAAGVGQPAMYGKCTNAIYIPTLGADAGTMKRAISKREGMSGNINLRDHLTIDELDSIRQAEMVATGQLRRLGDRLRGSVGSTSRGNDVHRIVQVSAEYTSKLRTGEVAIPGLD